MKKKIFLSVFLSTAAVLLAGLLLTMSLLFRYLESVQKKQLVSECLLAAQGVETEGAAYFDGFAAEDFRITLIAGDGTVQYDTSADAATMENHGDREEVREAMRTGVGESERDSDTVLAKNIYYAKRLSNGDILRVSVTYSSVWALLLGMLPPVCLILFGALVLSLILAERVSARIVQPLNNLNLEDPLSNQTYAELSPLLNRIAHLHRDIDAQLQLLAQKREEFTAVTGGMAEGLVLLGKDGTVLSINRAAAELFSTDQGCVGMRFLTVCRSTAVQQVISSAMQQKSEEAVVAISGREYRLSAAPVMTEDAASGVCLLAFDVTEKIQSERMRREFTANVSHELKTPLHAILGTAELLHSGLVATDDIPHFTEMITHEAGRLVQLINDIIRLSQLDEMTELPAESVDLYALAQEVIQTLQTTADAKQVTLTLHGASLHVTGVRTLLYEILYNLCENAIRYNVPDGRVEVFLEQQTDSIVLRVSDTGIGIPDAHQARIFERFYRVDKGRSRDSGGTGLGLSIVKHAAEYHHAKLQLKSKEGVGTEITVLFAPQQ